MSKIDDVFEKLDYYIIDEENHITPSDSDIDKIEDTLHQKLPIQYRYLLKNYGGTALSKGGLFTSQDKHPYGKKVEVDSFLGFSKDDDMTLPTLIEDYRDRIPDDMIPIAMDSFGNLILLGIWGEHENEVWLWDHEYHAVADQLENMIEDLNAAKVDLSKLDTHAIINIWENIYPEKLTKPKRFSNMYLVSTSLENFLDTLEADNNI